MVTTTKLALLLAMTSCIFSSVEALPQCKDIDESSVFDINQCNNKCKEKHSVEKDKVEYSESEKGGAFAYKCDCDGKAYCLDKKYDESAKNDLSLAFCTALSPWAVVGVPGLLLGLRNL